MSGLEPDEFPRTIISGRPASDPGQVVDAVGHYLVIIGGTAVGRRVEIAGTPITIGRNERQALVFADDTEVSRVHARLSLVNGEAVAEDLGSTNGTFVDGQRITSPVTLREGSVVQVGAQCLKYERRSRRDVERMQDLDRDLNKAAKYLLSMLPAPIDTGPVRAEWCLVPSAQLGGDAFGYYWLDSTNFVMYLIDVSGHGAGAAMHSVAVLNVFRQRALTGVDFKDPAAVLSNLNERFQMHSHHDMYFTMWYGVYSTEARSIRYSSAGHHPAYLVPADRSAAHPLGTPALMIGALPDAEYQVHEGAVPPGSTLYVFSDGVFEIVAKDEKFWALSDFLPHLTAPALPGVSDPQRLYRVVQRSAQSGSLEDDFSLLAITFR